MKRILVSVVLSCCALGAAERFAVDSSGRLLALYDSGEEISIRSSIAAKPYETPAIKAAVSDEGGKVVLKATAEEGARIAGMAHRFEIPRAYFEGGSATLGGQSATLGKTRAPGKAVLSATATSITLKSAGGSSLSISWSEAREAAVKDEWTRRGRVWAIEIAIPPSPPDVTFAFQAAPDKSPAQIKIDMSKTTFRFDGFGGNYCFNPQSPVADYTLNNLKPAWGRTEMALDFWEPENDNNDSNTINWDYFKQRDTPGSKIRAEFEMMRKLQQRGIPYVASIWWLPEWMYTDPDRQPRSQHRRKVAPTQWAEMLESIGSYLLYAKQNYGAEPDLFSFNEANIGVYVIFDPEEHREALKSIGAYLKKIGLKTKMLLADATGPNGTYTYALAAANDAEALSYCGAIAFHSWGGAPPEMYKLWGDVAEWVNLPLLVAEVGVDASAHQRRTYDAYEYGLREVKMYQELLTYSRPQSLLYWEFTPDYSLVRYERGAEASTIKPTERFAFVKHYTNLTPQPADSVQAGTDHEKVLVTAFKAVGGAAVSIHISNHGSAREASISGIPDGRYRMITTRQGVLLEESTAVTAKGGTAKVTLPERGLATLTTMNAKLN